MLIASTEVTTVQWLSANGARMAWVMHGGPAKLTRRDQHVFQR